MHLHSYKLKNYRRLRDTRIDLAQDISIFVGANNSGKTSATQAIQAFLLGSRERFSLFDFSSDTWQIFDTLGSLPESESLLPTMPSISLDLWFEVAAPDLYLVLPLLPSTAWEGTQVGIRIEFCARSQDDLLAKFRQARKEALESATNLDSAPDSYVPWPKSLTDYLRKELSNEFEFRYFVLDRAQFDENYLEAPDYLPQPIVGQQGGAKILRSLIRVDNLNAQRHLADLVNGPAASGNRSEDLSKRLSRFYQRNLDQKQSDHTALRALFKSEEGLDAHLAQVFKPTLEKLARLGYPGVANPRLEIRSGLNPASIMNQDARVHYILGNGTNDVALPDNYNGLGFKNLIYMVVEILDLHAQWMADEEERPPLHLIFIEEPEAHLHAQLQQVFVRQVLSLLDPGGEGAGAFQSQVVVTTHSPHIVYERGFKPIRYFKRQSNNGTQTTEVLNLSAFYSKAEKDRDFLERYLKLTHCDLFFSDAVILVEGNVERLLLPIMIDKEVSELRSACICILEVGGAFGHRFEALLNFLGVTVLVITDLDSVTPLADPSTSDDEDKEFEILPPPDSTEVPSAKTSNTRLAPGVPDVSNDESALGSTDNTREQLRRAGKVCPTSDPAAVTANQTLIQWLPKKLKVVDLLAATPEQKTRIPSNGNGCKVRVAYQLSTAVKWNEATQELAGRTFEEAFGLENAEWCQAKARRPVGLNLRTRPDTPTALAKGLHDRVKGKGFDKTKFALAVLTEEPNGWTVPLYIREGLAWLKDQVDVEAPRPLARSPQESVPPTQAISQ